LETPDPDPYASLVSSLLTISFNGFDASTIITILIVLLLLGLSALISASETAYFSLRPADLNYLKEESDGIGEHILQLRSKPQILLATILIINNLVNISIVILTSYITLSLIDFKDHWLAAFFIQVVGITSLILLLGEISPKIYANKMPLKIARLMVKPLAVLIVVFKPLSNLLVSSTSFIDKRLSGKQQSINMSDLSAAIEITTDETTTPQEKKMLKGIASFGEKEARSVMKSRVDITAVDARLNFEKLLNVILNSGYSRIPVYDGNLDKILGLLYIKDLLPFLNQSELDWLPMIRPAFFVPESKKINDLLQEFREKKIHLAIVVDEYGGTAGLITLEDIIEEIVGDISDEFDKESDNSFYSKTSSDTYVFEGRTNLVDFIKVLGLDDHYFEDVQGESDTLAGLILELEGRIPEAGLQIRCKGFLFEVLEADSRRIKRIKVSFDSKDEK
jgi:gliding motility-associated protein GldE